MDRAQLIAAMEAAAAVKPEPVSVPIWGGTVYVRTTLTVDDIENSPRPGEGRDKRAISRAAARVLCDENGAPLFDPSSDSDVELIARQPWDALKLINDAAAKANGTAEDSVDEAGKG